MYFEKTLSNKEFIKKSHLIYNQNAKFKFTYKQKTLFYTFSNYSTSCSFI
jgi:hypothetical protein